MKKRQIGILSVFVSIITLLLIVVQVLWIKNASESKKRDFESAVSIALDRTVDAISQEETYTQIIDQLPANSVSSDKSSSFSQRQTSREGVRFTTRSSERIPYSQLDSFSNNSEREPYFNDSSVVELLKKENKDSANSSTDLSRLNTKSFLVEKMVDFIFKIELPIEQRMTIEQADTILRNELKKNNITADFELAVINHDDIVLFCSPKYYSYPLEDKVVYAKQLFPQDYNTSESYYLSLYFPEQNFYILQSLWVLIAASLILTLLILGTFIANLLIIAKQKKTAETRNAFVSNLTHEFKTPIATISLASQMLKDENIPVTAKNIPHLSQMLVSQSKKLTFLVEQVLQLSIFNKGDYQLKKTQIDVHDAIKKVLSTFSLQVQEMGAKVIFNLEATKTAVITDELHYTNVISNLFDNALKYSKENPSIKINTVNKDNGILVSISDNGIGISKDYQKRIFEQFFRVPSGNVHDVKGFGLGLSYVKKITEIMGGQIWLHSEIDKGSTFFVWIPFKTKSKNK